MPRLVRRGDLSVLIAVKRFRLALRASKAGSPSSKWIKTWNSRRHESDKSATSRSKFSQMRHAELRKRIRLPCTSLVESKMLLSGGRNVLIHSPMRGPSSVKRAPCGLVLLVTIANCRKVTNWIKANRQIKADCTVIQVVI